jgi:hypothetical protein
MDAIFIWGGSHVGGRVTVELFVPEDHAMSFTPAELRSELTSRVAEVLFYNATHFERILKDVNPVLLESRQ